MGVRITRRRLVGALVVVALGAGGAALALKSGSRGGDAAAGTKGEKAPVALEFGSADLAYVTPAPMSRWLPVSGTLAPVSQATVKAKVSGDVLQVYVREGESVRAGQVLARIDTADLEVKLIERQGALESARAHGARGEDPVEQRQAPEREVHLAERVRQLAVGATTSRKGSVKSVEAQVRLAENALRTRSSSRRSPVSCTSATRSRARRSRSMRRSSPSSTSRSSSCRRSSAIDVPGLALGMPVELSVDGFGERRFAGRIGRINPSTEPGTRAIMVYVGLRNPDATLRSGMFATGRIALAASEPIATLPFGAVRIEAGQSYVWAIEGGKLSRRIVVLGRRERAPAAHPTALPATLRFAARFHNLKEGAPARSRRRRRPERDQRDGERGG
jgi:multidrug efflux pump subunit AcrA (membrane-fusion protein)